jgi:hypothetical protein
MAKKRKKSKDKQTSKITRGQVSYYARKNGYDVDEHGNVVHLMVWRKAHGKPPANYDVHHINTIKKDNRIENLVALPKEYHNYIHQLMRKDPSYANRFTKEFLMEKYEQFKLIDEGYKAALEKAEQDRVDWMNSLRREAAVYPPPPNPEVIPEVVLDAPRVILRKKVDDSLFTPGLFDDIVKSINDCKNLKHFT